MFKIYIFSFHIDSPKIAMKEKSQNALIFLNCSTWIMWLSHTRMSVRLSEGILAYIFYLLIKLSAWHLALEGHWSNNFKLIDMNRATSNLVWEKWKSSVFCFKIMAHEIFRLDTKEANVLKENHSNLVIPKIFFFFYYKFNVNNKVF